MLDIKFVREHLDEIKVALAHRGLPTALEDFEALDGARRLLLSEVESLRYERNNLSENY